MIVRYILSGALPNNGMHPTANSAVFIPPEPGFNFREFLPDMQQIGQGLIVGTADWQAKLENNKVLFSQSFVIRLRFLQTYTTNLTPAQFVDALFAKAGVTPSALDRDAAINEFGGAVNTVDHAARARALRRIAENSVLAEQEKNRRLC